MLELPLQIRTNSRNLVWGLQHFFMSFCNQFWAMPTCPHIAATPQIFPTIFQAGTRGAATAASLPDFFVSSRIQQKDP